LWGLDFLALVFTPQTYIASLRAPAPPTWVQAFVASLTLFYVWAALTPLMLWLEDDSLSNVTRGAVS